jgi:2-polyprenyl-3-methyl-5-hydroxy-6-metoxy-1,4-benzoquinol methylase
MSIITNKIYDNDEIYFETMSQWLNEGVFAKRINNILSTTDSVGLTVLDAGCGVGTFSIECAKKGCNVYAIDFSMTSLKFTKRNAYRHFDINPIKLTQASVEKLPFLDCTFDTVIAADIIEHIYSPEDFLDEIYRVLKTGGQAIFETPNIEFMSFPGHGLIIKKIIERIFPLPKSINRAPNPHERFSNDYHVNTYNLHRFQTELSRAGFFIKYLNTKGWWLELRGYDKFFNLLFDIFPIKRWGIRFKDTDILAVAVKQDE